MINATLVKKLDPEYVTNEHGSRVSYNSKGQIHSFNDQPALINNSGTKYWFKDGKLHRDNDLPAAVYKNGYKGWWIEDKFIRSIPVCSIQN